MPVGCLDQVKLAIAKAEFQKMETWKRPALFAGLTVPGPLLFIWFPNLTVFGNLAAITAV